MRERNAAVRGSNQRHGGAIGMAHQRKPVSRAREDRFEQCHLVAQRQRPIRRPGRAFSGAERVGRQDVKRRRQAVHQPAPCDELLAFACRHTTAGPWPASRPDRSADSSLV
jgi:hypothetical protein